MRYLLFFALVASTFTLYSQGTDMFGSPRPAPVKQAEAASKGELNRTDEKGLRQGPWEKLYENGRPAYKATFKDGKPVGTMTRYYSSGKVKVSIDFGAIGDKGYAQIYNEAGNVLAKGIYRDNQKDSTWTYFYPSGKVASVETFVNGVKNGKNTIYYTNGRVAEELTWVDGKKEGTWLQFYESGKIKLESSNKADKIEGGYRFYFENGKVEINGLFVNGLEQGLWSFYLPDGKLNHEITFNNGIAENSQQDAEKFSRQLAEWEQNKEKLRDPEKMVNDPEAAIMMR
jgi:antitoxin component YwqK of YwqJK toxin-antitoxin module